MSYQPTTFEMKIPVFKIPRFPADWTVEVYAPVDGSIVNLVVQDIYIHLCKSSYKWVVQDQDGHTKYFLDFNDHDGLIAKIDDNHASPRYTTRISELPVIR